MALFNFRKNADLHNATQADDEPVETVEALRRKTLHRLIGSAILVVLGVIVFSLTFDRQPRPIPVDVDIRIPSRDAQPPLVIGAPASVQPAASVAQTSAPTAGPGVVAAPVTPAVPAPQVSEPAAKPVATVPPDTSEADRAKALLEGKPAPAKEMVTASSAAASGERFIVQVGAFADPAKARQTRLKVEAAGLKTYTHVAETSEGKRIRVRVGPFSSRAEAEKAAQKIKSLQLQAAILTL